jgi:hypothetical protein
MVDGQWLINPAGSSMVRPEFRDATGRALSVLGRLAEAAVLRCGETLK